MPPLATPTKNGALSSFFSCASVCVRHNAPVTSNYRIAAHAIRTRDWRFPYTCACLCHVKCAQLLSFAGLREILSGSRRVEHGHPAILLQLFAKNGATRVSFLYPSADLHKTF